MNLGEQYQQQGYLSPIDIIDASEVATHRNRLEMAESKIGTLHYLSRDHTVLTSPAELVCHHRVLDVVEPIPGPDILVCVVAPQVGQTKLPGYTAWLAHGLDRYGYYGKEKVAQQDLDQDALLWREQIEKIHRGITATD